MVRLGPLSPAFGHAGLFPGTFFIRDAAPLGRRRIPGLPSVPALR